MTDNIITFDEEQLTLIQQNTPIGFSKFVEYMKNLLIRGGGDPSKVEAKEMEEGMKNILFFNPRVLYTFFDDLKIFVSVYRIDNIFKWECNGIKGAMDQQERAMAERESFKEAFKQINL